MSGAGSWSQSEDRTGHQPPHTFVYSLAKLALYLFKISRNFIFIYDLWQESFRKYIRERKNINKYMCLLALLSKQKRELSLGVKSIATNLVDIIHSVSEW